MSGRLFTEIREKRGLVYWVGAWQETPRGSGMMFLGASTTPERCDQTFTALLHEVDRLAEDLTEDELERAITGIVANQETRGDSTRARCTELANDLFFFGRPVPVEEKLAKIRDVRIRDICRYLEEHPRERLCVATLGPRPLTALHPLTANAQATEASR
jgi:predicted Zn-dependent peptidase